MKTKYDKIAKHIRKINELLEIGPVYNGRNNTITLDTLRVLRLLERNDDNDYAFTTASLDRIVRAADAGDR